MIKNIKMVAFDLDGTVLTSEKKFTEYTRNVIARAVEQGVVVLPATGRPLTGIPEEILKFPGIRYAVTANGGRVADLIKDEILYEKLVPVDIARKVLDIYEHYDTLREVYYNGVGYAEEKMLGRVEEFLGISAMAGYILATRTPVENIREKFESENKAVDKVQAIFADVKDKEEALKELQLISGIEVTGALVNNIEVSAEGVNKGKAVIRLGGKLGIRREEIMTIGDGANDIEMLKEAGFGVAMANSTDEVKAHADYITDTNDEEGAAKVIEQYVLR